MLEAGERCGDVDNRQVGEGPADHNGTCCGPEPRLGLQGLRCRATSYILAATLRYRALAVAAVIRR